MPTMMTRTPKRRYKSEIFEEYIWTSDLAYVLGLLTTDGSLSSDKRHITFTSKDLEQINNFKNILYLDNKIGLTKNKNGEYYRIQFSDVKFYDWLISVGLSENKSMRIGSVNIPDEFFKDFLRGHLDGDGSITTYIDRYNTKKDPKYIYKRIFVRFISGSKDHIDWLAGKTGRIMGASGAIHMSNRNNNNLNPLHILKFGKKDSLKLLSKIYYCDDIPSLNRKRLIYKNFLINKDS